jgi:hypothetical protein
MKRKLVSLFALLFLASSHNTFCAMNSFLARELNITPEKHIPQIEALNQAIKNNDFERVKHMLKKSLNPNVGGSEIGHVDVPLIVAVEHLRLEITELLIRYGADITIIDSFYYKYTSNEVRTLLVDEFGYEVCDASTRSNSSASLSSNCSPISMLSNSPDCSRNSEIELPRIKIIDETKHHWSF